MALFSARGLSNFISEIRSCTNADDEQKRIDKELNKLRQKFTQTGQLNSYDKKKYAWKLIYIYMLGYDIDFGHMQVINLVSGTKYSEKCLGYLGVSILLKSSDELMTLVINSILNDLCSPDASFQCLALCCVANLGGMELCETLAPHVVKLLMSSSSICHVRKKAALCLRRIIPAIPDVVLPEELEPRLQTLLEDRHLGVVTSAAGLLQVALTQHPTGYKSLVEIVLDRLAQLVHNKGCPRDYMYYATPSPWLQIKLLRILQQFGIPDDVRLADKLNDTLRKILGRPSPGKGAKNNAIYAVLFETVNLVISHGKRADPKLHEQAIQLLARFISVSEPNIRYIGLDSMNRLLITVAGADVPDDVWHRVVQIVTNNEHLQQYTAAVMFRALEPKHVDETTAKVRQTTFLFGAYVVGEFGFLNVDEPDMSSSRQFEVLLQHYTAGSSIATKCVILTAFIKMDNLFEDIRPRVLDVFKRGTSHVDLEAQQRACEYFTLHHSGDDVMKTVLEPMPVFPDTRESNLVLRLRAQQHAAEGGDEGQEVSSSSGGGHDDDESAGDLLGLSSPTNQKQQLHGSNGGGGGLVDVFGGPTGSSSGGKGGDSVDPAKIAAWFN
ncbi:hypothetical protein AaE_000956, partial [Aphanomyces astaci]